jgi:hypothetical protein
MSTTISQSGTDPLVELDFTLFADLYEEAKKAHDEETACQLKEVHGQIGLRLARAREPEDIANIR